MKRAMERDNIVLFILQSSNRGTQNMRTNTRKSTRNTRIW